jgi:non-heme chloroperoxidase
MKKFALFSHLTIFVLFLLLGMPLIASSKSSSEACKACSKLKKNDCKVKKMCVTVPARQTDQGFIPEAKIYVRMQGRCKGNKPILLFVHGVAFSSDTFRCQQEELCERFCTISLDLRGYGRSTKTTPKPSQDPNSINYTYEVFADDIKSVLTQLGVEEFIFVGSSLGANIGIFYTLRYPGEVQKLVLASGDPLLTVIDPNCTGPNCQILPTCDWQFPAETLCSLNIIGQIIQQIGFEEFLRQFLAPNFFNEPCQDQLVNAQNYTVEAFLTSGLDILLNATMNAETEDLRPLLPLITIPTLICYGSIDDVVPPGASLYMHDQIKNSVIAEFVDKGHMLQVTAYKQFNQLLTQFIFACSMPNFSKIFDEGCCVCPKVKPIDFKPCD